MESFKFNVQGSNPENEPYEVEFFMRGGVLSAHCNCQAGNYSKLCGHRLDVLEGFKKPIDYDENKLKTVLQWYQASDVKVKVTEKNGLDNELKNLKSKISAVDKEISKLLHR